MKLIINYAILTASSYTSLEIDVLAYIELGWVPQGGVSVSVVGLSQNFYQVMVMYDD
jgi:hypothetical protein